MTPEDLLKSLAMVASMKTDGSARDKTDEPIEQLAKSYLQKHEFKVGDRVVLKKGMGGMHRFPTPNQVCIVVDVLDQPFVPTFEKAFGTPHFMMPHDIRIATKDSDGDFVFFLIDSKLFEPVKSGKVVELKRK